MFLVQVSDIQKISFLGIPGLLNKLKMLTHSWTGKTRSLNDSSLKEFTTFLHGSNESRTYLASIGESVRMDSSLMKIFRNMRIPAETGASKYRTGLLENLKVEAGIMLEGAFSLHGVTRTINVPLVVNREKGGTSHFSGKFSFRMSDYKISPPSTGGVVNVKDEMEIRFELAGK